MDREERAAGAGALLLAIFLFFEFAPALSLSFVGDDFELFSLARIGGFSPLALFVPHRGGFVKPVLNIAWATLAAVFGPRPAPWHATLLAVHLLDAALLGLMGARLSASWRGGALRSAVGNESSRSVGNESSRSVGSESSSSASETARRPAASFLPGPS